MENMTIIKTAELTGNALDWAVGKASAEELRIIRGKIETLWTSNGYSPSTNWAHGGPIIEREFILLRGIQCDDHKMNGQWLAMYDGTNTDTMVRWVKREDFPRHYLIGPTPLIAAMRCFVAGKLGDSVEIPSELL